LSLIFRKHRTDLNWSNIYTCTDRLKGFPRYNLRKCNLTVPLEYYYFFGKRVATSSVGGRWSSHLKEQTGSKVVYLGSVSTAIERSYQRSVALITPKIHGRMCCAIVTKQRITSKSQELVMPISFFYNHLSFVFSIFMQNGSKANVTSKGNPGVTGMVVLGIEVPVRYLCINQR
jgi:hypothetical protein